MAETSTRATRAPLAVTVELVDERSRSALTTHAEDISTSGMFVRCAEPYIIGTTLRVALALDAAGAIETVGRVVRIGPGASGHVGMGIMFTFLDDGARAAVARVVAARLASLGCPR